MTVYDWQGTEEAKDLAKKVDPENVYEGDITPLGSVWCNVCDNPAHECTCEWDKNSKGEWIITPAQEDYIDDSAALEAQAEFHNTHKF